METVTFCKHHSNYILGDQQISLYLANYNPEKLCMIWISQLVKKRDWIWWRWERFVFLSFSLAFFVGKQLWKFFAYFRVVTGIIAQAKSFVLFFVNSLAKSDIKSI